MTRAHNTARPAERKSISLSRGDLVGVVATGYAVRRNELDSGVERLRRMGYRVRLGKHVLAREGYLAGDDDRRVEDLGAMIDDDEVRAIWFARGGYGTARILDRVPWHRLRRKSKLLIGYSDMTALFAGAVDRCRSVCLYGPVVSELGTSSAYHSRSLLALLRGDTLSRRIPRRSVLAEGKARGRLVGGNLTVLGHLVGTRFAPRLVDSVLFLEEVGEQTYRIDRVLTQCRSAGLFRGLAGVVLGHFIVPPRQRFPPDRDWLDVMRETFLPLGIPVVRGIPAGHGDGKWTVPLGGIAELDTRAGRLRLTP